MNARFVSSITAAVAIACAFTLASGSPAQAERTVVKKGQTVRADKTRVVRTTKVVRGKRKAAAHARGSWKVREHDKYHARRHYDRRNPHRFEYERVRFRPQRYGRRVIVRPVVYHDYVIYRPRYVIVRPVPYWVVPYRSGVFARIGINTGPVQLGIQFADLEPHYGCPFCETHYSTFETWEWHVQSCSHRGSYARVIVEPWSAAELAHYRDRVYCEYRGTYWG